MIYKTFQRGRRTQIARGERIFANFMVRQPFHVRQQVFFVCKILKRSTYVFKRPAFQLSIDIYIGNIDLKAADPAVSFVLLIKELLCM